MLTLIEIKCATFNGNFNQNGADIYLSKQNISVIIRDIEIVHWRNF